MASVINQIKLGDVEYALAASAYAECSTAAATAAKAATICADDDTTNTAFTLIKGVSVQVKFAESNSAANPTLNVNGTEDKAIYYNGEAVAADYLKANHVYTFVYNGAQWEIVGGDTELKYSNSKGAARFTVGGLPEGFDFTNEMSVKQILDKIFFPHVNMTVDATDTQVKAKPGTYTIPNYPTLESITIPVAKNDTAHFRFQIFDTTSATAMPLYFDSSSGVRASILTEKDIKDGNLSCANFSYQLEEQPISTIAVPARYAIKYQYMEEDGKMWCEPITLGTYSFDLQFKEPSTPVVFLRDSAGNILNNSNKSYKVGQSCTVSRITVEVPSLNSAVGDDGLDGIKEFLLSDGKSDGWRGTAEANSDKKSCSFPLFTPDVLAPTYNTVSSGKVDYTYKAAGKYNARGVHDPEWSTDYRFNTDYGSAKITFTFEPASCVLSLAEIDTSFTRSKLDPVIINTGDLQTTFKKNSDKIESVDLYVNGKKVDAYTLDFTAGDAEDENLTKTTYDTEARTKPFAYSANAICSNTTFQAKANCKSGIKASSSVALTYKAPYCWGFIDDGTSIDRTVLESFVAKGRELNTPQYSLSKQSSIKIDNQGYKKFVYALPKSDGVFSAVTDNNSSMDSTKLFNKTEQTITFADGSTVDYQIWVLKGEGSEADVNLAFS